VIWTSSFLVCQILTISLLRVERSSSLDYHQDLTTIMKKKHVKGKGLNLISPNDFENEVHEEFVVFALVAKNVLEKALEEVSAVLKEF